MEQTTGQVDMLKFCFKWEISHFCMACDSCASWKPGDSLVSRTLSMGASTWKLRLFPKGQIQKYKDYVSIFFEFISEVSVEVQIDFYLVDAKKNLHVLYTSKEVRFKATYLQKSMGRNAAIKMQELLDKKNDYLVDNKLTIVCEITEDPKATNTLKNLGHMSNRFNEIDDFEKLLNNQEFSDVILILDDKQKFYAHKNILASRSAVFAGMFKHDMRESQENVAEIKEMEYEVLQEMLRFIYTGKVKHVDIIAKDLLVAADRYAITGLKVMCENLLCEGISIDNAVEYLNLADLLNAEKLKQRVIDFIVINSKEMVDKPEFKMLTTLHPDVILQALSALVKNEF